MANSLDFLFDGEYPDKPGDWTPPRGYEESPMSVPCDCGRIAKKFYSHQGGGTIHRCAAGHMSVFGDKRE